MSAEEEMPLLLAAAGDGPAEASGTAALFEAISGRTLSADVVACPAGRVLPAETAPLHAEGRGDLHGLLGLPRYGGGHALSA
jgi:hypothetical protein